MVVLLFISTVIVFLIVEYIAVRLKRRREAFIREPVKKIDWESIELFDGLFYSPGHSWAALDTAGTIALGVDKFLLRLLGKFDRIESPGLGTTVKKGDTLFTIHQGGRKLEVPSPFSGLIVARNREIEESPSLLDLQPQGWAVRVRPKALAEELGGMKIGLQAREWLNGELGRLRDFFCSLEPASGTAVGMTLLDGGLPLEGALQHLNPVELHRFKAEFLGMRID